MKQSIDSILQQTVPPNDIVIVCDGELTRELDEVIDSYKNEYPELFNIVKLPNNQGLAVALDSGLEYCKNDIVARMDSDDIAIPTRCERQLKEMALHNADIVGSAVMEFLKQPGDSNTIRRTPEKHADIIRFAKRRNPFNHPSVIYRKSMVQQAGGYQLKSERAFLLCEDYYLWVRMAMISCCMYNVQDILLYMRTGEGLYKRRGGLMYLFNILRFKSHIREIGFSSWVDFLLSIPAHFVFCLAPNWLRKILYKLFLRKN